MAITINGTGSITGLTAGGLPDGSVVAADLASSLDLTGKTVTLPSGTGGKILQVVQTVKTDGFTSTSTTLTDVTGLSVSITPSSSSNKILVLVDCAVGGNNGYVMLQLVRGSTNIYSGTDSKTYIASKNFYVNSANVMGSLAMVYLDSPATTSSVTYKIQMKMSSSLTGCINRRPSDDTSMASGITVLEVAA